VHTHALVRIHASAPLSQRVYYALMSHTCTHTHTHIHIHTHTHARAHRQTHTQTHRHTHTHTHTFTLRSSTSLTAPAAATSTRPKRSKLTRTASSPVGSSCGGEGVSACLRHRGSEQWGPQLAGTPHRGFCLPYSAAECGGEGAVFSMCLRRLLSLSALAMLSLSGWHGQTTSKADSPRRAGGHCPQQAAPASPALGGLFACGPGPRPTPMHHITTHNMASTYMTVRSFLRKACGKGKTPLLLRQTPCPRPHPCDRSQPPVHARTPAWQARRAAGCT
jgi:hypothetical protein